MVDDIEYPLTPEGWRNWLEIKLKISEERGREMVETRSFPFDVLIAVWEKELCVQRGYDSSFIPALTRNKQGFVEWVYLGLSEPNWSKSDKDATP